MRIAAPRMAWAASSKPRPSSRDTVSRSSTGSPAARKSLAALAVVTSVSVYARPSLRSENPWARTNSATSSSSMPERSTSSSNVNLISTSIARPASMNSNWPSASARLMSSSEQPSVASVSSSSTRLWRSSPSSPSSSPSAAQSTPMAGAYVLGGVRARAEDPALVVVLGIDPGTANTGYGVFAHVRGRLAALDGGLIATHPGLSAERRLTAIHLRVTELLGEHHPDAVALEDLYFGANARSAFAVGQARGVVMLAAGQAGLPCASYTPQQVKGAVCGNGRAAKDQVQRMVQALLSLADLPRPDHAADALAVAICHTNGAPLAAAMAG